MKGLLLKMENKYPICLRRHSWTLILRSQWLFFGSSEDSSSANVIDEGAKLLDWQIMRSSLHWLYWLLVIQSRSLW
jgi:hypothetical protein